MIGLKLLLALVHTVDGALLKNLFFKKKPYGEIWLLIIGSVVVQKHELYFFSQITSPCFSKGIVNFK